MYMGSKLLNRITSIYVNSLACVKGGKSECFMIDNDAR